jgi:biopolymer transport protein ExbB
MRPLVLLALLGAVFCLVAFGPLRPTAAQQPPSMAPAASAPPAQATSTAPGPDDTHRSRAVADDESAAASTGRPHRDLSPWSMFLAADVVVKAVMVSLGFASLVTWTIFFTKSIQLAWARYRLRRALARIADAPRLADAQLLSAAGNTILSALIRAAIHELGLSGGASASGIKERAASRFAEIVRVEARTMRQGMAILATIGATAPFVGLFGTVWGIMNSFIGISKAQTTNLAVVAPGIAESLLATAIGLVAAIPAVIIYNYFSRATKGYLELVSRGSGAVGRLLSRDLEHLHRRPAAHAAE